MARICALRAALRSLRPHCSRPFVHCFGAASQKKCFSSSADNDAADSAAPNSLNLFQQTKGTPPGVRRLTNLIAAIPLERTRNFSIIAHIDHGKSTLADKLLESTHNIFPTTKGRQQVLDNLEVERTRGITVKAQSASMVYFDPRDSQHYLLNLFDTPGHIDFSHEVARSLAACQGALVLVDAAQGVQAQTVANHNAARDAGLAIVPVLTKIDLPTADPEPALAAMEAAFGMPPETAVWTSAKSGAGIADVFPAIIDRIPAPGSNSRRALPLRCLLFDSWYDTYRGVVCSVLVVEGSLGAGDVITAASSRDRFTVQEVGLMAPSKVAIGAISGPSVQAAAELRAAAAAATPGGADGWGRLHAGQMGYIIAGMKSTKQALVGDTFSPASNPQPALAGFRPAKPMVFASLYPVDSSDFSALCTAIDRLTLNDASVSVERESSASLGFGLRCGFLGLLHMDVFNARLQQEFAMPVIATSPMVPYRITMLDGSVRIVERPSDFPPDHTVSFYEEPVVSVSVMTPVDFLSPLLTLLLDRRGVQEDVLFLTDKGGAKPLPTPLGVEAAVEAPASSNVLADGDFGIAAATAGDADVDGDSDDEDEDGDDDDEDDSHETRAGHQRSRAPAPTPLSAAGAAALQSSDRVVMRFRMPWAEVVTHLNDAVKSQTAGYASLDWSPGGYARSNIVKVDVLLNGKPVDALSFVAHKDKAVAEGKAVCQRLKASIDRQQFEVVIQAAIGAKPFARERVAPYRKDVLLRNGKVMGGGDVTRKMKLLSKQKEGKKRMRTIGNVELSQEAFHSIIMKK